MWRRVPCEQQLNMGQAVLSQLVTQLADEGVCVCAVLLKIVITVTYPHLFVNGPFINDSIL